MNRISETKFFNFANKKYNYNNKLSKINFKDYYIPSDLINDKLNNEKVLDVAYFRSLLYKYNVGDTITLKVYRDNSILDLKVKLDVSLLNS